MGLGRGTSQAGLRVGGLAARFHPVPVPPHSPSQPGGFACILCGRQTLARQHLLGVGLHLDHSGFCKRSGSVSQWIWGQSLQNRAKSGGRRGLIPAEPWGNNRTEKEAGRLSPWGEGTLGSRGPAGGGGSGVRGARPQAPTQVTLTPSLGGSQTLSHCPHLLSPVPVIPSQLGRGPDISSGTPVARPTFPLPSGALRRPLAASQDPQQLGGQQELCPLDHHDCDQATTHDRDISAQPLSEWGAAALQVHHSLSCILIQAQDPEATLVIDRGSIFPGVDAAGGRKAAGLDPGGTAVKEPAGHTGRQAGGQHPLFWDLVLHRVSPIHLQASMATHTHTEVHTHAHTPTLMHMHTFTPAYTQA